MRSKIRWLRFQKSADGVSVSGAGMVVLNFPKEIVPGVLWGLTGMFEKRWRN
jgi:hypothetical protein